MKKKLNQG